MSKIIDITDKLNFDENPSLKIKDKVVAVNADAPTMIKIMALTTGEVDSNAIIEMYNLIFPEESRDVLEKLKLSFNDLIVVVKAAVSLVTGTDEDSGEE